MSKIAVVFGGSGFLGRYVILELVKKGYHVKIVSRNPDRAKATKVSGTVGQVATVSGNILNEHSIRDCIKGADVVVNLVGILFEKGRQTFTAIHSKAPENIARISAELNVKKLVHVSALSVDKNTKSKYLRTKVNGENAVLAAFPNATIIRPSIIFGFEDDFFNKFAKMLSISPFLPAIGGGKTKFQPVYVVDVAQIIAGVADDKKYDGSIIEVGGPNVLNFKELLELVNKYTDKNALIISVPYFIANFIGIFSRLFPKPLITNDQITMLKIDNIVEEESTIFTSLAIEPTPVEHIVPEYLRVYRNYA